MESIKEIINKILEEKKEAGGIKQVFYVACGGSLGAFYPAKIFLETEAVGIKTGWYNSNEFIHNLPKSMGENSVLIVASHKGNTPETVEAARIGKERGIPVIVLTWIPDSPITQYADYVIPYTFGDNKDIAGEKTIKGLLLAVEILNQTEGYPNYEKFMDGVSKINQIVRNACRLVQRRAREFARNYKDDKVIYTIGSGADLELLIWNVSVFLWKCSGSIPMRYIQENISMDPLRLRTKNCHLSCSYQRERQEHWMSVP